MERGMVSFRKIVLTALLVSQTVYSWLLIFQSFSLDSDEGAEKIVKSIQISFYSLVLLLGLLFIKGKWIFENKKYLFIWLMVGSPVTFMVLITIYVAIAIVVTAF